MRGYAYDRRDVTGRSLANAYAQTLGTIFTEAAKPYEVELVVAEVGAEAADDQIYRLTFDGSVADEHGFVAMGGSSESISAHLAEHWGEGMSLTEGLRLAIEALAQSAPPGAAGHNGPREVPLHHLEVALLQRDRTRRTFRRIPAEQLRELADG
jgi:proteasome alpha subunit